MKKRNKKSKAVNTDECSTVTVNINECAADPGPEEKPSLVTVQREKAPVTGVTVITDYKVLTASRESDVGISISTHSWVFGQYASISIDPRTAHEFVDALKEMLG